MGNGIYNFCGRSLSPIEQQECIIDSNESYGLKESQSAIKIQKYIRVALAKVRLNQNELSLVREFDEKLLSYGHFITEKDFERLTHENVLKIKKSLPKFEPITNELKRYKHTFEKGPFKFNDNTAYKGQWNFSGKKHGFGVFIRDDGSMYEGFWLNDEINGRGRYIDHRGNYYIGEWKNGMANGKGKLVAENGSHYNGSWKDDLQEGYGEEFFNDGTSYKGNYRNGQKNGKGNFTWGDGSCYDGNFVNSTLQGFGIFSWKDGRKYTGHWLDNKMHGNGVFIWPDGKRYEGEYKSDKKEGHGTYYWAADKYYKGEWLNGKKHGEGIISYEGKVSKAQYRFGKIIKNTREDDRNVNISQICDEQEHIASGDGLNTGKNEKVVHMSVNSNR